MSTYLDLAERVLRDARKPLTAMQMLRQMYAMELAPAHLHGRTQHKTLQARLSAMPHHMSRAFPLFGKLDRFGRVAVVADQAWMRFGSRLESAILPNISYRVCAPDERDDALEWAMGKQRAAA